MSDGDIYAVIEDLVECKAEIERLRTCLAGVLRALDKRDLSDYLFGCEDGEKICEALHAAGLLTLEKYDPERHMGIEDAEPGQDVWIYTPELRTLLDRTPESTGEPRPVIEAECLGADGYLLADHLIEEIRARGFDFPHVPFLERIAVGSMLPDEEDCQILARNFGTSVELWQNLAAKDRAAREKKRRSSK